MPELAGRVADAFEARIRAHEESALSPLAVRSYETRGRLREEDECGIRTPFQRDRDRIVHSKPFRRLKGKTQVFIDPAGDHYRTRITHTLETTGIARVVARALRLNEDLTEAIGLGHDMGHPPFGHAGEERLDACLRERFGTGFHHNEQSLRIAEQLNLTAEVRDGILTHTGPQEPQTLEGKIVRLVDRVAYINHDIDDAIRWGLLTPDDLPRAEIELLGETGSTRIDTLVHDLIESSERAGDVVQSEEVGSSMLALRAFMFERVYLGEHARGEHVRAHETISAIFEHLVERGESEDEIRTFVSGMTDRLRPPVRRALSDGPRSRRRSVREVVAASDMVEVVSGRTSLRKAGARYSGRCPFHEERTPSFSVNPADKLYHCFGCGKGGDVITFVRETENLDFAEAVEWLAERFRVNLEYEETSPQLEESRKRRDRLHAVLEQATSFYERHLWETAAGAPVREYLASRGLGEPVCREFRLGLSPGSGLAQKAQQKGFTKDELRGAGLTNARGSDYFPPRLMFPLADARGRVVGFQARKLHEDDPLKGKYVNSPEGELFHKSAILYGLNLARTAIAKQERAVVVEGNTDVIALRQAGFEPVVASMGTALTDRQLKELQRLSRRIYLCFDSDAAGEDATLRGMELATSLGFDVRVVTLPKGQDPADAPDGFEKRLVGAESYVVYRVRLELDRTPDRQEAFVRAREILQRNEDSPEWQDALRLLAGRLDLPKETLAGLTPKGGVRTLTQELSPKMLAIAERLERDVLAACVAHPTLLPLLAEVTPEHFESETHRRFRAQLLDGGDDGDLVGLKAELDARVAREGIDERTGRQLLLRLRERRLRKDATEADPGRQREVAEAIERVRAAIEELSVERA